MSLKIWEKIVLACVSFLVGLTMPIWVVIVYVLGCFVLVFMINYYRWKKGSEKKDEA